MTRSAPEGHANPFPQSESKSQQKSQRGCDLHQALYRPLLRGSSSEVCWKVSFQRRLAIWSKRKSASWEECGGWDTCDAKPKTQFRVLVSATHLFTGCRHGKWEIRLHFNPDENPWWQVWRHFKGKVTSGHLNVSGNSHYQQRSGAGWTRFNSVYPPSHAGIQDIFDPNLWSMSLFVCLMANIHFVDIAVILVFIHTSPATMNQKV